MAGDHRSGNRTKSNPNVAKRAENVDPDMNSRVIDYTLAISNLPKIDMSDEDQVRARVNEFFRMCSDYGMRPLVGNLALSFNMSKPTLWRILSGASRPTYLKLTDATTEILKNAYWMVESSFEQILADSKNSVPLIYYSKAAMDWREAPNETVITHRRDDEKRLSGSADEVASKYAALVGVEEIPEAETYELPAGDDK